MGGEKEKKKKGNVCEDALLPVVKVDQPRFRYREHGMEESYYRFRYDFTWWWVQRSFLIIEKFNFVDFRLTMYRSRGS